MPTYFTPCVSYSFRHLIKLESKNYLVSRKTFTTSMWFLEIENYALLNANEFQTFIFQKNFIKLEKPSKFLSLFLRYSGMVTFLKVWSAYIRIPIGLLKMLLCGPQYKFPKFRSRLDWCSVILQKELQTYSSCSMSFNYYYLNAFRHLNLFSRHLELAMSKTEFIIILTNSKKCALSQCKIPLLLKSEHSRHSHPLSSCQWIL